MTNTRSGDSTGDASRPDPVAPEMDAERTGLGEPDGEVGFLGALRGLGGNLQSIYPY